MHVFFFVLKTLTEVSLQYNKHPVLSPISGLGPPIDFPYVKVLNVCFELY